MSITVRCQCGKKYQLKDDAAGKKFRCKECSEVVKVPAEQIDDLEDANDEEDDWDDGEMKLPVRKKKKKSSKAAAMAKGIAWEAAKGAPAVFLKISGIISGVIGYMAGTIYFIIAGYGLLRVQLGAVAIGAFMAVMLFMGARAAMGFGLKVSSDTEWTGNGSIITGICLVGFGILLPVILISLVGLALQ